MSPSDFFEVAVSFVKFSFWFEFHVNVIISFSVTTIFPDKGLTRNPEIGNTPVWVLLKIRRLGQVRDTKFDINISNEMLQNASKCYGHSLFLLFLNYLRGTNRWGGGVKSPPPDRHTHRVKLAIRVCLQCHFIYLHISSKQLWHSQ